MEYIKMVKEDIEYNFSICKDIAYTIWVDTDGLFNEDGVQTGTLITTYNKN